MEIKLAICCIIGHKFSGWNPKFAYKNKVLCKRFCKRCGKTEERVEN